MKYITVLSVFVAIGMVIFQYFSIEEQSMLRSDITSAQKNIERKDAKLDKLHNEIERKNAKIDEQLKEHEKMKAEFEAIKSNIKQKETTISEMEGKIEQLNMELETTRLAKIKLYEQHKRISAKLAPLEELLNKIQTVFHEYQKQVEGKQAIEDRLREDLKLQKQQVELKLTELMKKMVDKRALNQGLIEKMGKNELHIKLLSDHLTQADLRSLKLEQENMRLTEDIISLSNHLAKYRKEYISQQASMQLLTQQLAKIRDEGMKVKNGRSSLKITFIDQAFFYSGSANLTQNAKVTLKKVAGVLENQTRKRIRIVGHADDMPISHRLRSKYPSNWELSMARANSVLNFLLKNSRIAPKNCEIVGRSIFQPIANNSAEDGRRLNRRVEILITPRQILDMVAH